MILGMKAIPQSPYLAAEGFSRPIPLERFLPDCPVGVTRQALSASSGEGDWVLDPFGSNPLLDIEAASCGRRVLVAANNPILAFTLKMLAAPRPKNDYLSALAELASEQRGDERLETHLSRLYTTRCTVCHNEIQAVGYIWQRGLNRPQARLCRCPLCGDEGEHSLSEEDLQILGPIMRGEKLPYARAVARVLDGRQEDRPAVEEALKLYNPRALYVLFTLLNKLEGMDLADDRRPLLEALMLSGLDAGTSLWPWPNSGDPPRQLTVPAEWLEKNLWTELEKSIALWSQPAPAVEMTTWPELPAGTGICLFPGPVRSLQLPPEIKVGQILALPPRPNQALWTLSALWSAWLWGREAETSFNQVLGRRRFDWHWHTQALHQALKSANELSGRTAPLFMSIGEPSAGMMLASCAAAHTSGLELSGLAMQGPDDPVQLNWQPKQTTDGGSGGNVQSITRSAIQTLLTETDEPAEYLSLFCAVMAALVVNGGLPAEISQYSQEKSSELQGIIARLFNDRDFLRRFDNTSQELDSGKWGLVNPVLGRVSLADRLEVAILQGLRQTSPMGTQDLRRKLNQEFQGLLTPPSALVEYCLRSCADWQREFDVWVLRSTDTAEARRRDLDDCADLLQLLAQRLGYAQIGTSPLVWQMKGEPVCRLWISETACLSMLLPAPEDDAQNVLVLPGSRSELLKYKMLRDPQLREATTQGWHFLKFRSLRNLAARTDLTPTVWQMQLDSDPITLEETTQLRIFG